MPGSISEETFYNSFRSHPSAFLLLPFGSPTVVSSSKPNIIFIMADDLGCRDLGCYGQASFDESTQTNLHDLSIEGRVGQSLICGLLNLK